MLGMRDGHYDEIIASTQNTGNVYTVLIILSSGTTLCSGKLSVGQKINCQFTAWVVS